MAPDEAGLVAALLLDGKGGARALDWAGVRAWRPEQGPLWVHVDRNAAPAQRWLREASGLDELVADALLAEETRPRARPLGGGWLLLLRGVNLNPGAEPEDMVSLRLWTDGRRVVSTRLRPLRAVATQREALLAGEGAPHLGALVVWLATGLVENMEDFVADLRDRLDGLEEQVLGSESRALRGELSELRRETVILRRYLGPQRDALQRLHAERPPWLDEAERAALQETNDALTRYVEDLDAAKDRAAILQEHLTNRISERMERRMYALALIATIFLPLTFVTGLLGINVGGIPGAGFGWAFWIVCGLMVSLGIGQLVLLRRLRWFG